MASNYRRSPTDNRGGGSSQTASERRTTPRGNGSRPGEGAASFDQEAAAHAEREQRPLMLVAAEPALDGGAAHGEHAPARRLARDQRVDTAGLDRHWLAGLHPPVGQRHLLAPRFPSESMASGTSPDHSAAACADRRGGSRLPTDHSAARYACRQHRVVDIAQVEPCPSHRLGGEQRRAGGIGRGRSERGWRVLVRVGLNTRAKRVGAGRGAPTATLMSADGGAARARRRPHRGHRAGREGPARRSATCSGGCRRAKGTVWQILCAARGRLAPSASRPRSSEAPRRRSTTHWRRHPTRGRGLASRNGGAPAGWR